MTYTLVADGSSDKVLLPILTWSLKQYTPSVIEQWADFTRIPRQRDSHAKLAAVLDLYPCDCLFIHRDAESQPPGWRRVEIAEMLKNTPLTDIPVVPVRMTEAWLLVNEKSIRRAAGNPNGTEELKLPAIGKLESIPDPKKLLHDALSKASGRNPQRRSRFPIQERVHRISSYIDDYSVLTQIPAFRVLQEDIRLVMSGQM